MKIKKRDLSPGCEIEISRLSWLFFGAGTNIARYIVSAFLLIYYSNVLYLGLTQVGVVIAASKCFDGVSDILMGCIIDKTKSKYGKARPWYLRMILPLPVCMLFLFWMPPVICMVCLGLSVLYDLDKKLPVIEVEIKDGRIGGNRNEESI